MLKKFLQAEVKVQNKNPNYSALSFIYNYVMKNIKYDDWAFYIYSIVDKYFKKDAEVLELGAGNCRFANYFKFFYPNILVSDLSIEMLKNDSKKVLPKVCCNMTELPFKKKYDIIYSIFDSVNYLLSKNKLLKLFTEVKSVLSGDGIFTFDVSLENNSLEHLKTSERRGITKGIKYIHNSFYNPSQKIHTNKFRIIFPDSREVVEVHKQKIYNFNTYFKLLDDAGFFVSECYEDFTFKEGSENSKRVQFVVKKKKEYASV